jgi:hypothetical protein
VIAVSIILTAIAAYATGFAVGRIPSVPKLYRPSRRRVLPLPGARVVLDRRADQRADISSLGVRHAR